MSKFDLREALRTGAFEYKGPKDSICGLKSRPVVFVGEYYDDDEVVGVYGTHIPRNIRRVGSQTYSSFDEFERGDLLFNPLDCSIFIAPLALPQTTEWTVRWTPILSLWFFGFEPSLSFDSNARQDSDFTFQALDLETLNILVRAFEPFTARKFQIKLETWIADNETFKGCIPRATPRRLRKNWSVCMSYQINRGSDGIVFQLYMPLHNEQALERITLAGGHGNISEYTDEMTRDFHDQVLDELNFRCSLRQEAMVVSGDDFGIQTFATGPTLVLRHGETRLHVHRIRFNPARVDAETKAKFPLLVPIGYKIRHVTYLSDEIPPQISEIPFSVDPCGSRYWAWPHYFLTEVAPVLLDWGLPAYCVLWTLDYLPNMAGWQELAKIDTILAVEKSMRRVRAQRDTRK